MLRSAVASLALLAACALPLEASATGLTFTHPSTGVRSGFTFTPGTTNAQLQLNHICNPQTAGQSIYLHAWYSTSSNPAGSVGYDTALYSLGTLAASTCASGINATTPFTRPPAGTYYVHILLSTTASPNNYDDALTSSGTVTVTGTGGGSPGGGFSFNGNISYDTDFETARINAGSICNGRSSGTSGTLY